MKTESGLNKILKYAGVVIASAAIGAGATFYALKNSSGIDNLEKERAYVAPESYNGPQADAEYNATQLMNHQ